MRRPEVAAAASAPEKKAERPAPPPTAAIPAAAPGALEDGARAGVRTEGKSALDVIVSGAGGRTRGGDDGLGEAFAASAPRGGYGGASGGSGEAYRTRLAEPEQRMPALKAGTTDDNADFNAYLAFLSSWSDRPTTARGYRHIDVRERSYVRVVDAAGRPVPGVEVRMRDPADQLPVWRARTLGDGRAVYFPRIVKRSGRPTVVEVDHAGLHAEGVLVPGQDLTLTLAQDVRAPGVVPLDVLFLIDTTGSMGDEIGRIKETLMATTAKVRGLDRKVELRYGAVLYRDKGDDYVTREIPFTADVRRFQSEIMQVQAGGGGDTPEHLDAGLSAAVNLQGWRGDAAKVVFLIADAPPHLDYGDDVPYADSIQSAVERGIRVHAVAASGLDAFGSLVFRQIAQYTAGKFIFIEYGGSVAATAASHGVTGQVSSNNLDDILFREIKSEVLGFGT